MASFQGCAVVVSAFCPPRTNLRLQTGPNILPVANDALSNIWALESLFAPSCAHDKDSSQAQKRRKVDDTHAIGIHQVSTDDTQSIVLASVSIDLETSFSSHDHVNTETRPRRSQDSPTLLLDSVQVALPNVLRVVLRTSSVSTAVELTVTTHADFLETIRPHLQNAAILSRCKSSQSVSRAAFCYCQMLSPTPNCEFYRLKIEIRWTLGISAVEDPSITTRYMRRDLGLLAKYFSNEDVLESTQWTLADFYDAVYVPPSDLQISPRIQQSLTETMLYPFQKRAVDWLLRREGVVYASSGVLEPFSEPPLLSSFRKAQDATGQLCYFSQLQGKVVRNPNEAKDDSLLALRGGILAEEMGLGKTVELIALITHHRRDVREANTLDDYTGSFVRPSGATLIITPPSILKQWESELAIHAPGLKVFHYKGLPISSAPKSAHELATTENLMRYDLVLTTYAVLSREIHYATPPPDRVSRHKKRHERRVSPLMGISWWRVCLDEAQMVESGVSQAAKVARIIPRCNAWAVSGTPLRKDVQDLSGLLLFLRCDKFADSNTFWRQLDKASFKSIFQQIALRHSKDRVRNELCLPPQKRVVITVPFTAIEDQHYIELMRQMCDACRLTPRGTPREGGRAVDDPEVVERMREWLIRLRQTCLHANVGQKNRKALGAKSRALRTVHEVLEVMVEQNDTAWKSEAREMISSKIKTGHVMAYAGNIELRASTARNIYEEALIDVEHYVEICRAELLHELQNSNRPPLEQSRDITAAEDESNSNDEQESAEPGRVPAIRKSLRSFLELEHACKFFVAMMYHQMKEREKLTNPESEDCDRLDGLETSWYEQAKTIRHELLKDAKRRAQQQMTKVSYSRPFNQFPLISDLPGVGGIQARKILEMMDNVTNFLNAQAEQIKIWRTKIVDILLLPLVDDEDEPTTGEEYDNSLVAQDELYVYMMALRTLIADRNTTVHGLRDTLVDHEAKEAERRARQKPEDPGGRGHAPELVIEVFHTRRQLQAGLEGESLKGVVSIVRSLVTGLQWKADGDGAGAAAELDMAQRHLAKIQLIVNQQAKTIVELEKEQEMFRATMNQRLEYYRQFQRISDMVGEWKHKLDETFDHDEFDLLEQQYLRSKETVAVLKAKHTYLTHLRAENQTEADCECIICKDVIEIGVLTACGHKYCKECINAWWHEHRTCPLCKKRLHSSDFKDITFKPSEIKAHEEQGPSHTSLSASTTQVSAPGVAGLSSSSSLSPSTIYSDMNAATMREIKMIDLNGSYGTKIDSIARHLLWIRSNDPGAKSIIFSQFNDFLNIMSDALRKWGIGATSMTEKDGITRFKADPGIETFLLDAKSDSSGLNLVNATYVFLCEPLINAAIELQAIARVHRIGQMRATTVFMYLIEGTVEEAIYEISVRRRLEHMKSPALNSGRGDNGGRRDNDNINGGINSSSTAVGSQDTASLDTESTLDKANSAELQAVPLKQLLQTKGDGEVVPTGDIWRCLFGKRRREALVWARPGLPYYFSYREQGR